MFFVIYEAQSEQLLNPKLQFRWEGFQILPSEKGAVVDISATDDRQLSGLSPDEVRAILPTIDGAITFSIKSPHPDPRIHIGCWLISNLRKYLIDFALPSVLLRPVILQRRVEPMSDRIRIPAPGGVMPEQMEAGVEVMGIPSRRHIKGLLKGEEIFLNSPMQDDEGYLVFKYTPVLEKNNQISQVPCFMVRGDKDVNHRQVRAREYLPGLKWEVLSQIDVEAEIMVVGASGTDARDIAESAVGFLRSRGYVDAPAFDLQIAVSVLGAIREGPMRVGESPGIEGLSALTFRVRLLNLIQSTTAEKVDLRTDWGIEARPNV
jgi:hypothetical protein